MSEKWTAADLPDQSGKTFVVTGASAGLGESTTRALAQAGARVVMAVRNEQKATAVVREIGRTRGRIEIRRLDVSSLDSVAAFADSWSGPIDVLVNNAGISLVPLAYTGDGLERQMATNYFGAVALTGALLPHVTDRVVSLSSQLHRVSRLQVADLNWKSRKYDEVAAYCDSKLAVVLFATELQRRLAAGASAVRSITAHPGDRPYRAGDALAQHLRTDQLAGPAPQRRCTRCAAHPLREHNGYSGRNIRRPRWDREHQGTPRDPQAFANRTESGEGHRAVAQDRRNPGVAFPPRRVLRHLVAPRRPGIRETSRLSDGAGDRPRRCRRVG
ncbi:hypothetical protein GCM10022222_50890 [Amycolatopsis ultiminotia]|uniref:Uncharacterized protein n=1 Tax=Amycolatopsis ultiminotia TaxID=543629 RepID=A0ABP6X4V4_9PSEU